MGHPVEVFADISGIGDPDEDVLIGDHGAHLHPRTGDLTRGGQIGGPGVRRIEHQRWGEDGVTGALEILLIDNGVLPIGLGCTDAGEYRPADGQAQPDNGDQDTHDQQDPVQGSHAGGWFPRCGGGGWISRLRGHDASLESGKT